MNYYIDLFSPETYQAFTNSDRTISGFSPKQETVAKKINVGDKLICYVTKISRFVGVLEICSKYFIDDKPIFYKEGDPYILRFKVKTLVWLPLEKSVPIMHPILWDNLSITGGSKSWMGLIRGSLQRFYNDDAEYLEKILNNQNTVGIEYPLTEKEHGKLKTHKIKTHRRKTVNISVPENEEEEQIVEESNSHQVRDSIKIQALLAEIGEKLNMMIWIPKSDRNRISEIWQPKTECLLDSLPLNYDDATLNTIENIDVLWIKRSSIIRAFEVEHTTSIYSGILRMADLMALQPNLDIKAHIVAPDERKEKVFQEITRPVFTLLEKGPLHESCTYISYSSVIELSKEKRLEFMNDKVLNDFSEEAEV